MTGIRPSLFPPSAESSVHQDESTQHTDEHAQLSTEGINTGTLASVVAVSSPQESQSSMGINPSMKTSGSSPNKQSLSSPATNSERQAPLSFFCKAISDTTPRQEASKDNPSTSTSLSSPSRGAASLFANYKPSTIFTGFNAEQLGHTVLGANGKDAQSNLTPSVGKTSCDPTPSTHFKGAFAWKGPESSSSMSLARSGKSNAGDTQSQSMATVHQPPAPNPSPFSLGKGLFSTNGQPVLTVSPPLAPKSSTLGKGNGFFGASGQPVSTLSQILAPNPSPFSQKQGFTLLAGLLFRPWWMPNLPNGTLEPAFSPQLHENPPETVIMQSITSMTQYSLYSFEV